MCVYNGGIEEYVYLLVKSGKERAICRYPIDNLGGRKPVLSWTDACDFAELNPKYFTFSNDGTMYIGTDYVQPIMILNPDDGTQGILYKDILPSYAEKLVWSTKNYLYMLIGGDKKL